MPKSLRSPRQQRLMELLIAARRARGLTQTELAVRLGKPQSYVAKYETGERRIDVIEFLDIATTIGIDVAALLSNLDESAF
ncbi:helix-turn-helix transcriptional regulator [Gluconacetobacter sacchari]|uniref:Helix-turn-helix transcriptional regulator n=2 Tax=Gluconacetobacter sacchari TaxID=92759 RepID=A0A7W4ID51_9PROT|nr:helix-turn-helix transcriptional regulator [Gluconacetobacter sacchari]MBB2160582.1 helix-turn-helix transcriptional regulator [Gluconacetobacter sacchari]